jgi:hypothetical protein
MERVTRSSVTEAEIREAIGGYRKGHRLARKLAAGGAPSRRCDAMTVAAGVGIDHQRRKKH